MSERNVIHETSHTKHSVFTERGSERGEGDGGKQTETDRHTDTQTETDRHTDTQVCRQAEKQ